MMRCLFLIVVSLLCMGSANASSWDNETKRLYRQAKVISLQIDFSNATIMGLDSADCSKYLSGQKEKLDLDILLKRFRSVLSRTASEVGTKELSLKEESNFVFLIKVKNVSDKAGILAEARLFPKEQPERAIVYAIDLKGGRWNSFDNLFMEAAEKIGKAIAQIVVDKYSFTGDPLRDEYKMFKCIK